MIKLTEKLADVALKLKERMINKNISLQKEILLLVAMILLLPVQVILFVVWLPVALVKRRVAYLKTV